MTAVPEPHSLARRGPSYLEILRRRWWIVLAPAVVAVAAALAASALEEKRFRATATLVVAGSPDASEATLRFGVRALAELIETEVIARNVVGNLHLDESPEQLLDRLSVEADTDSLLLRISVEHEDGQRATQVAQEVALVFAQLVKERYAGVTDSLSVTLFDPPPNVGKAVEPERLRNAALALGLGLALGLFAAFAADSLDRSFRTREEIEHSLGALVLGEVAGVGSGRPQLRETGALHETLRFVGAERPLQTILVASGAPSSDGGAAAAALALALAGGDASVALVDAELGRPGLHERLGRPAAARGLSAVLAHGAEPAPEPDGSESKLTVLAAGPAAPNPSALLSGFGIRDLLQRLANEHDYVVLAGPPVELGEAGELPGLVDGVVLALPGTGADSRAALAARALVERQGGHVAGVLLSGGGAPPKAERDRKARPGKPKKAARNAKPEPPREEGPESPPGSQAEEF